MAYATFADLDRTNTIDKIKAFVKGQGYSESALSASTDTDTQFVLSNGGAHFAFRFFQDWLYVEFFYAIFVFCTVCIVIIFILYDIIVL